jgi:NADP-dependent 3-hydroxy acid dehydrogenase YdfG
MQQVAGKVAFITGGASGMGLAMARSFSSAGMKIVVADVQQDALDRVKAEFGKSNASVLTLKVDVTDRAGLERAAREAERAFGKIHVVCNNAGVAVGGTLDSMDYKDWDWVMGVNLDGVVNGLQVFVNRIKSHGEGGHIVNTASMAGHLAIPGLGVYNATKWAVVGISETLRAELAPHNIGVSVLCPGVVNTNIFDSGRNRPASLKGEKDTASNLLVSGLEGEEAQARIRELLAGALDAAVVGDMVLAAIQADDPYIFTHPEIEAAVEARFAGMHTSFERWRRYRAEHGIGGPKP